MTEALVSLELEQTLLGAVLAFPKTIIEASFLVREDFAYDLHQGIWQEIVERTSRGESVNPLSVATALKEPLKEIGGVRFINKLTSLVYSTPQVSTWAHELKNLSLKRQVCTILDDYKRQISDPSSPQSADEQIADLMVALERATKDAMPRLQSEREIRENEIKALHNPPIFYSTGFGSLDAAMGGGIYKRRAYGFAGRMKSGKTLLASQITHALNAQGIRTAYFACEMGAGQIEHRAMASEIGVNSLAFLDPKMRANLNFMSNAARAAVEARGNILYRDAPGMTFDQMRRDVTHAILGRGAQGFVIDYLQLVGGKRKGSTTAEHLDDMSQWIAETCAKRDVFAIVLCQLNQEGNVRGGEGIKLAFDQVYELRRTDNGEGTGAWLDMMATRYTKWKSIGSELMPALNLNTSIGPRFEELGSADG